MMAIFNKKILDRISQKLLRKKQTIAVAESVTSGLLQFAFSQTKDAARFFQGGITCYNLGQKVKHLNVEPIHAAECDCVSASVAEEMALKVAENFKSDWAISITGYATPVPESGKKLFCYYSIVFRGTQKAKGKITHSKSEAMDVQLHYVNTLLANLEKLI